MSYPNPLKCVVRLLTPNVVIASCPFKRMGALNFGGRMSLIKHADGVLVYAAIPFGEAAQAALKTIAGADSEPVKVTHLVIPDVEHTMAVVSFKEQFPDAKVISMEGVSVPGVTIDYTFTTEKHGNKCVAGSDLTAMGISLSIANDFEFVYLPHHGNKELVLYNKPSKIVFEADLLFNLGHKHLEQYSPELGYNDLFNPHGGLSFLTRYMVPTSRVGNAIMRKICNATASAPGLKAIYQWDFSTLVPCHGNVFTNDGKLMFKKTFPDV